MKKQGTFHEMDIPEEREVVETDKLSFPWNEDKSGYFLIKIENGQICCGFMKNHRMVVEFRGNDQYNMLKEIAKRELINLEHMAYLGAELERAKRCLENNEVFVQR